MKKGTGVVTSVPSDAPDDYAALKDIMENRGGITEKYGIDLELLKGIEPVPIIDIPEIGIMAAVKLCEERKVTS